MRKKEPLVSVIMPVYNGPSFVGEAMRSILTQTYRNLELIVVNDGSQDNTQAILDRFAQSYPQKLRVISYQKNKGESAASNIGFAASRGEFVARMDADDISYPTRISEQVKFMLAHPEVIVLGTQADVIDENGKITGSKGFPCDHKTIDKFYGIYHPMLHPSCMFRRSLLPRQKHLWENTHEPNDDYYTLFGLLRFGKFANLPQTLVAYRMHLNNKSLQQARSKVFHALKIRRDAVRHFGYRLTWWALLVNAAQFVGALILPERLIVSGYLIFRGMISSSVILSKFASLSDQVSAPFKRFPSILRQALPTV